MPDEPGARGRARMRRPQRGAAGDQRVQVVGGQLRPDRAGAFRVVQQAIQRLPEPPRRRRERGVRPAAIGHQGVAEMLDKLCKIEATSAELPDAANIPVLGLSNKAIQAVGEEEALIQLDKLDANQRLLDLGFERIDLRSSDMVVVRRRDTAPVLAAPAPAPAGVL